MWPRPLFVVLTKTGRLLNGTDMPAVRRRERTPGEVLPPAGGKTFLRKRHGTPGGDCFYLTAEGGERIFLGVFRPRATRLFCPHRKDGGKDAPENPWFSELSFGKRRERVLLYPAQQDRIVSAPAPLPLRRRKFHILCFRASAKTNSFHCTSSPNRTRLRWASVWYDILLLRSCASKGADW